MITTWLKDNWDKLLGIAVSGVVGFYTALWSINSNVNAIGDRTTKIETELASAIKPKIPTIDQHTLDVQNLRRDFETLQKQTDLSVQTNKLLDLRLEQERQ